MRAPREILLTLARAKREVGLFSADHPTGAAAVEEAHRILGAVLAGQPQLRIMVYEEAFYIARVLLLEDSVRLDAFLADLIERGISIVDFTAGLTVWELSRFLDLLNLPVAETRRVGAAAYLRQHRVRHISVRPPRSLTPDDLSDLTSSPTDLYRAGLRVAAGLYFQAAHGLPLVLKHAHKVVAFLARSLAVDPVPLLSLAALRTYDEESIHHPLNVAILALAVGVRARLDLPRLMVLGLAALLHDIGKARLPSGLLTRPWELGEEERAIAQRHPVHGAFILRHLTAEQRLAMVVAFEHHVGYDRSGYPALEAKPLPSPWSRVVAVLEFYDAAAHARRPHRLPVLPSDAVRFLLDEAGRRFDPVAVQALVSVVGLYPIGSLVELNTGALAVVLRPGRSDPARPTVRIVRGPGGAVVDAAVVDLAEVPVLEIVRALDPAQAAVDPLAHLPLPTPA